MPVLSGGSSSGVPANQQQASSSSLSPSFVLVRVGQLPQPIRVEVTPESFTAEERRSSSSTPPTVLALRRRIIRVVNEALAAAASEESGSGSVGNEASLPFRPFMNCRILRRGVELQDSRPIERGTFTQNEHLQVLMTDRREEGAPEQQHTASTNPAPPPPEGAAPFASGGSGNDGAVNVTRLTAAQIEQLRNVFIASLAAAGRGRGAAGAGGRGGRGRGVIQSSSSSESGGEDIVDRQAIPRPGTAAPNPPAAANGDRGRRRGGRGGAAAVPTRLLDEANADGGGGSGGAAGLATTVEANRLRLRELVAESSREPLWRFIFGLAIGFLLHWPSLLCIVFYSTTRKDEHRGVTSQFVRYRQGPTSTQRRAARDNYRKALAMTVDSSVSTTGLYYYRGGGGEAQDNDKSCGDGAVARTLSENGTAAIPIVSMQSKAAMRPDYRSVRRREGNSDDDDSDAKPSAGTSDVGARSQVSAQSSSSSSTSASALVSRSSDGFTPTPPSPPTPPRPFFGLRDTSTQALTALHDWSVSSGLIRFRLGIFIGVMLNFLVGSLTTASVSTYVTQY